MIISRGLQRIIPQLIEKTEDYLESQDKLTLLAAGSNSHILIRKKAVYFEYQVEAPVAVKISVTRYLHKLKRFKIAGYLRKSVGFMGRFISGLNHYVEGTPESIAGLNNQQDVLQNWHLSRENLFADPDIISKFYLPYLKYLDKTSKMSNHSIPAVLNTYSLL